MVSYFNGLIRSMLAKLLSIIPRLIILITIFGQVIGVQSVLAQTDPAQEIFNQLSVEQKIGQLFLISFDGTDTSADSKIHNLITNYDIGGVLLSRDRNNFSDQETGSNAKSLIYNLQLINYQKSINEPNKAQAAYIPLFIGISQEGGGFPNDQILNDLTLVPNQIAIGASWNREIANEMGTVLGQELAALGFNFYYGLSLDVLTLNDPSLNPDLSTRLFGGDPYWVGELGKAFTQGVHNGTNGKMLVIAKHFPGRGGSDRPAEIEIPTIRVSLEDLKSVELAPFFAVTSTGSEPSTVVDGLLVSHIRYQGFQGNIRATTKPISFDQQALAQVLGLEPILNWRTEGGLIVTDSLGSQAVRNFYDPDGINFSARLVARDAFLAGSDLLQMGNIRATGDADNYSSVVNVLEYFVQRYNDDENFANRVDESVMRILRKKLTLSNGKTFNSSNINPSITLPFGYSPNESDLFGIARESATLLSPSKAEFNAVLPAPPQALDYLVFFTDSQNYSQCANCDIKQTIPIDSFQMNVNKLYGPSAGGSINPAHLSSFSLSELELYLDDRLENQVLSDALKRSDWVIISTQEMPEGSATLITLRRLLDEKHSLLANKKVILFSFDAPYYLDSTDISKLTAYYNLYDPSPIFVNLAARLLFQEVPTAGASPVSVEGIGYDLLKMTSPDPTQIIRLYLSTTDDIFSGLPEITPLPNGQVLLPGISETPALGLPPTYKVGDVVSVSTGLIHDRNQHQVPDGTPVEFNISSGGESTRRLVSTTFQGVAKANINLERSGVFEISVLSEPAAISEIIRIDVDEEGSTVIIITPTPDEDIPTPEPTDQLPPPIPTLESRSTGLVREDGYPTFVGWLLLILIQLTGAFVIFVLFNVFTDTKWSLRAGLLALIASAITYNFVILSNPAGLNSVAGLNEYVLTVIWSQLIGAGLALPWKLTAQRGNKTDYQ
ncbi:MAG TPA: glycoside hydrolase family 3 N-terminal domain-containing protein [Anaerolineales bacterium]|nr:glycoside hydrolase family 3 N-terminal domain-containing protein [Anaerolineales bacterium]